MIPAGMPHDLTFAHREVLYLLAIPAVVLLWGLINAREIRRVFAPLMRAKLMVASMTARDPTRLDVIVRLRPSLRYSLDEAARSSSVECPSPTSSRAKRMPSAR